MSKGQQHERSDRWATDMTTLRLIELDGEYYAVQKNSGWWSWQYLDLDGRHDWSDTSNIWEYCITSSLKEAEAALERNIETINKKRRGLPKTVKVIKKVKV